MDFSENKTLLPRDHETIVALATARGSGAIALIRASGKDAVEVADRIAQLSTGKSLIVQASHTIHHGFVLDKDGKPLDEVLFLLMRAPKTFTGQDTVEISCHNNQFIINAIIQSLIVAGARQAKPGEFTMRGFLNNKFDLIQAEAINELIHAPSEKILESSLAQLSGSLSHHFAQLEKQLIELLTLCEASFEFLEEELQDIALANNIRDRILSIHELIHNTQSNFSQQQRLKEGIRVSLIGLANAGKSSLFNALLGKDRAIVADLAGTTRDSIEAILYKNGHYWLLIDTAGLRHTDDGIELQGIQKSYDEALKADIILLIIDASKDIAAEELDIYNALIEKHRNKIVPVLSKCDILAQDLQEKLSFLPMPALATSAHTPLGLHNLEATLTEKINVLFALQSSPFVLTQRQFNLIGEIDKKLLYIEKLLDPSVCYELMCYELRDLLERVGELTGKSISEEILDTVFSQFCIGK